MSSASLAVPRHAHPDSARIAALSVAIALNAAALLVLMRPMAPQLLEQVRHAAEITVRWIPPPANWTRAFVSRYVARATWKRWREQPA